MARFLRGEGGDTFCFVNTRDVNTRDCKYK